MKLITIKNYLLLIDEEAEITGTVCLCYNSIKSTWREDIILYQGTMPDYHYRGFQKIIAYYPLNSEAKELDLPLLPTPFKRMNYSDLEAEKLAQEYTMSIFGELDDFTDITEGFKEGYKAAQSKQFSLEDVINCMKKSYGLKYFSEAKMIENLQSLSQQLPKEFIPEYEEIEVDRFVPKMPINILKTIMNSEGKQELVGTYNY